LKIHKYDDRLWIATGTKLYFQKITLHQKLLYEKIAYRLVRKSNQPFLVLKGVTEMSFLVLKRVSVNSEEN
jgi:hypothetical protein